MINYILNNIVFFYIYSNIIIFILYNNNMTLNLTNIVILILVGIVLYYLYKYKDDIISYFNSDLETTTEKKEEVFNVLNNVYTYDDAEKVCNAFNSKLATYDQLTEAYNNGAEWCNYGWIKSNEIEGEEIEGEETDTNKYNIALYPMQEKKDNCGDKGINGGYFDKTLKFGVNCYGLKPTDSEHKNYNFNSLEEEIINEEENEDLKTLLLNEENIKNENIMYFNKDNNKWSVNDI